MNRRSLLFSALLAPFAPFAPLVRVSKANHESDLSKIIGTDRPCGICGQMEHESCIYEKICNAYTGARFPWIHSPARSGKTAALARFVAERKMELTGKWQTQWRDGEVLVIVPDYDHMEKFAEEYRRFDPKDIPGITWANFDNLLYRDFAMRASEVYADEIFAVASNPKQKQFLHLPNFVAGVGDGHLYK